MQRSKKDNPEGLQALAPLGPDLICNSMSFATETSYLCRHAIGELEAPQRDPKGCQRLAPGASPDCCPKPGNKNPTSHRVKSGRIFAEMPG